MFSSLGISWKKSSYYSQNTYERDSIYQNNNKSSRTRYFYSYLYLWEYRLYGNNKIGGLFSWLVLKIIWLPQKLQIKLTNFCTYLYTINWIYF